MPALSSGSQKKKKKQKKVKSVFEFLEMEEGDDTNVNRAICWRLKSNLSDFEKLYFEYPASETWRLFAIEMAYLQAEAERNQ